ncbi:hypothetical protein [Streptomyces daqingensis]|uniref:hypothetical protein n=1 Tax=Streptomyces daqingensis TaxID=1472640 RepID=UPI0016644691|nr:hypothetical protein [Streptomyces daqingensis]
MACTAVFCCFALAAVAGLLAARAGYRGKVCDGRAGYDVPERVKRDPELRREADRLVAFWCTGAAVLSVAPLVPVGDVLLHGGDKSIPTWGLLVLALYGLVVVTVGAYPYEKIKHMGARAGR